MSTGGNIPYHLRQNKAIERNLFIDLLSRIGRYRNISAYRYVGFGGPFLEDFKHLHSALRISDMISLEIDQNVYARQKFNRPISCVELRKESSGDFLSNYDFEDETNAIVWFDYATPDIGEQLSEVQRLIEKLGHGDIFKITVNSSPGTLGHSDASHQDMLSLRAQTALNRLGDYGPPTVSSADVTAKSYPGLLLKALLNAAKHGLSGDRGLVVQGLTAFVYSDGQQMLTLTGTLLQESELSVFFEKTRLNSWPFFNDCTKAPRLISVPAFSAKERVHVESMLPGADADQIIESLQYYVGGTQQAAKAEINNFINFYRLYPWYSRIVL